jgi:3-oxoacyl-[acyl-carrier protein] reductase
VSRVAIVTGASRGIGRAIAERLATEDLQIIGTATTESDNQRQSSPQNEG